MPEQRSEIVCLCGSMRFIDGIRLAGGRLTLSGAIVLAPGKIGLAATDPVTVEQKALLDALHRHKIDLADRVVIVNPGGYLGESTKAGIDYAQSVGKPVSVTEPQRGSHLCSPVVRVGYAVAVWIEQATLDDVEAVARLAWLDTCHDEPDPSDLAGFTADFAAWWQAREDSFVAYVARDSDNDNRIVGVAWVSLAPRVPRPGDTARFAGDIQSVYVEPKHRGHGTGASLVEAAACHAEERGAMRVTVSSGSRALPIYQRLGFASSPRLLKRP